MTKHKFTIFLFPDGDGYQVIIPHYPEATTWGKTPEHAFEMAKECLELILEDYVETHQEQILPGEHASHVVVGAIEAEVPDILLQDVRAAEAEVKINPKARRDDKLGTRFCMCGCGTENKPRYMFQRGHDANLRVLLRKVERGELDGSAIPSQTVEACFKDTDLWCAEFIAEDIVSLSKVRLDNKEKTSAGTV